ncbi:hypothetical protein BDZ91DRAFT_851541 [Kalaharituber pfeilii]|nr:hypothetical protein BDZ91DRAFT_851541 [Kalaharituber pfeilii]
MDIQEATPFDIQKPTWSSAIIIPSDGQALFNAEMARWSDYENPGVSVVVKRLTEQDAVRTVQYCNQKGRRFLVQNSGHGWSTMSSIQDVALIKVNGMENINIDTTTNTGSRRGYGSIDSCSFRKAMTNKSQNHDLPRRQRRSSFNAVTYYEDYQLETIFGAMNNITLPERSSAYVMFFNENKVRNPAAHQSIFIWETYPMQGMRNRDISHIDVVFLIYESASLDATMTAYGTNTFRNIHNSHNGYNGKPRVYVNYGHGMEQPAEFYAWDAWRQVKLANLKEQYDPYGRFNVYHPVPTSTPGFTP